MRLYNPSILRDFYLQVLLYAESVSYYVLRTAALIRMQSQGLSFQKFDSFVFLSLPSINIYLQHMLTGKVTLSPNKVILLHFQLFIYVFELFFCSFQSNFIFHNKNQSQWILNLFFMMKFSKYCSLRQLYTDKSALATFQTFFSHHQHHFFYTPTNSFVEGKSFLLFFLKKKNKKLNGPAISLLSEYATSTPCS